MRVMPSCGGIGLLRETTGVREVMRSGFGGML